MCQSRLCCLLSVVLMLLLADRLVNRLLNCACMHGVATQFCGHFFTKAILFRSNSASDSEQEATSTTFRVLQVVFCWGGGGGDVDACKGCMCASVHPVLMKFCTYLKTRNARFSYNTYYVYNYHPIAAGTNYGIIIGVGGGSNWVG